MQGARPHDTLGGGIPVPQGELAADLSRLYFLTVKANLLYHLQLVVALF